MVVDEVVIGICLLALLGLGLLFAVVWFDAPEDAADDVIEQLRAVNPYPPKHVAMTKPPPYDQDGER